MIRNFTIAIIILAVSSLAFGQMKSKPEEQRESVEKTLLGIERELADALPEGNSSAFERHLADTFVFSPPFGNSLNKTQMLEDVKYSLQIESSKREEITLQINNHTAVVTYRSTDKGFFKFVDIGGQYQWIDLFEKRNGQWQLIFKQGMPVHQPNQ